MKAVKFALKRYKMRSVTIGENDANQRLDKFMTKFFATMPQSLLYKYIRKKCVRVNGKHVGGEHMLSCGDVLNFYIKDEFFDLPTKTFSFDDVKVNLDIVYEDKNILLINKPEGVVCHESESSAANDTLISQIQAYLYKKGEYLPQNENTFTPALCNRLDRNTQGIIIAAKNAEALRILNKKIKDREIHKYYLCLAIGRFDKKAGEVSAYLAKDESKNQVTIFENQKPGSKKIITRYRVLDYKDGISLVEVELVTGRTHQIRAHLAYMSHPLVGDKKYGGRQNSSVTRQYQALCSYKLSFDFTTDAKSLSYLDKKTFALNNIDFLKDFNFKI